MGKEDFIVDAGFQGTSRWRPMMLDTLDSTDDVRKDGPSKSAAYISGRYFHPGSLTTEGIELSKPAPLYKYLDRGPCASPTLTKNWDDLEKNKPRILIPKDVTRPFDNLTIDDIKGTRSNPKNMKLGKNARGTSPLTPDYILPSYKSAPPFEPKFLRDSMNLEDIEGTRPSSRISTRERDHMNVMDIDGTVPGWRPKHRRNFGKNTRDLCLQVRDITPQRFRYVRDPYSEVYEPVEGTHPRKLTRSRSPWTPSDLSLKTDDIEGTNADSALLTSKVKMRKQKNASRNIVTTEQEKAELVAVKLLKTKVKDQMQGKSVKEVVRTFKSVDRQQSGKLTIDEIEGVFKSLDVGLNSAELRVFAKAFDTAFDGYLYYWNMVKHLVPVLPSKRKDLKSKSSKVVAMALNQWSQPEAEIVRDWQRLQNDYYATAKLNEMNNSSRAPPEVNKTEQKLQDSCTQTAAEISLTNTTLQKGGDLTGTEKQVSWREKSKSMDLESSKYLKLRGRQTSSPLPIHVPFWPEGNLVNNPPVLRSYLSLFHDHHHPQNRTAHYRVIDDSEKRWAVRVGENCHTGEKNTVCSTSYSSGTGAQWGRPSSAQLLPPSRCSSSTGWTRPSTAMSTVRPSTAMSTLDENVWSRPSTAGQFSVCDDTNMNVGVSSNGRIKRPRSASMVVRGTTPECLRTISRMSFVGGGGGGGEGGVQDCINYSDFNSKPSTANTSYRVQNQIGGRGKPPFSRIRMPPKVQRQLSQMMEDMASVKALM